MFKKLFQFTILLLIITLLFTPFAIATDIEDLDITTTSDMIESDYGDSEETDYDYEALLGDYLSNIYEGDLFIYESNTTIDKLVDGNAYIFGNDLTITGQIAGNLFIMGNNITLSELTVQSSIFLLGTNVTFNAISNDLYAFCDKLTIAPQVGVYRDINAYANELIIQGIVGRDANVTCNNIKIEDTEDNKGIIYGDLNYSANDSMEFNKDLISGEINYTKMNLSSNESTNTILDKIISLLSSLIFTYIIFLFVKFFCARLSSNIQSLTVKKFFIYLGIGLLTLIFVPILAIALMFFVLPIKIGFALLGLYALLISITNAIVVIYIANIVNQKLKFNKKFLLYLLVLCVAIVVWLLRLIPFLGIFLSFIILTVGLGLLVVNMFSRATSAEKIEVISEE